MAIGAIINGDYYFHYENSDIESLKKHSEVYGKFFVKNTKKPYEKTEMDFIIDMVKPLGGVRTTYIHKNFERRRVYFFFKYSDFDEWFLRPSEEMLEFGPRCFLDGSKVYVSHENTPPENQYKQKILNFWQSQ